MATPLPSQNGTAIKLAVWGSNARLSEQKKGKGWDGMGSANKGGDKRVHPG